MPSLIKPAGFSTEIGPYGEITVRPIHSCCHCQKTWEEVKGSGRLRGYCSRCHGYVCGHPDCMVCINWEAKLENVEAGRPRLTPRPEQVTVPDMTAVEGSLASG